MKSTATIYEQQNRVSKLLWEVTTSNINRVHPETGGSLHLAHNWGNDAAQTYLEQYRNRQHKLYNLFQKYYHKAFCNEYPNHLRAKSTLLPA